MTLILTCLTEEYVVQVSDRRLTQVDRSGKVIKVADDASNKALFVDYKYIVGYTGLAKLGGNRADLWLAERLSKSEGLPFQERLTEVARSLGPAVSAAPCYARRLAFVGAGYARVNSGPVRPITFHVSNFLDKEYRPVQPSATFAVQLRVLDPKRDFLIMPAGAVLFERHDRELRQILRSARKRGAGPIEIARVLAEAIWKVSRYNKTVGESLMICTLPRDSVERFIQTGQGFVSGGISMQPDETSFFYLGPETADLIQFGPTIVSPGMLTTDIRTSFGNEDKSAVPPSDIAAIHFQGPGGSATPDDAPCPCGSGKTYKGCHNQVGANA